MENIPSSNSHDNENFESSSGGGGGNDAGNNGGPGGGGGIKFDAQDYIGITEDDIVDYDTAEEYLLHFARIGQLMFVKKLILLKKNREIELDVNCKGMKNLVFVPKLFQKDLS